MYLLEKIEQYAEKYPLSRETEALEEFLLENWCFRPFECFEYCGWPMAQMASFHQEFKDDTLVLKVLDDFAAPPTFELPERPLVLRAKSELSFEQWLSIQMGFYCLSYQRELMSEDFRHEVESFLEG